MSVTCDPWNNCYNTIYLSKLEHHPGILHGTIPHKVHHNQTFHCQNGQYDGNDSRPSLKSKNISSLLSKFDSLLLGKAPFSFAPYTSESVLSFPIVYKLEKMDPVQKLYLLCMQLNNPQSIDPDCLDTCISKSN